ncbi:hypothetical protein Tco_1378698 [Tanacetum coccineum]
MNKRKKHFARLRAEEQRIKPPTKAQKRNTMSTYLKNMAGYKFSERSRDEKYMEIVPDDEVAIDAIPLATNPPIIVDWKIIKEGNMGYFQIIRADGSSKRYSSMIQMLQNIDREDLETLWKLVKAKNGLTRLEEGYERVLWGDLKVMFEPDVESEVWRNLQGHKVTVWKQFSSSGLSRVHNTFHVSNLKKCYADEPLVVPLDGLHINDKLYFVEEPVEIMDREVKRLRQSRVLIV